MDELIAGFHIEELFEGQTYSILHTVMEKEVNKFAELSGDISPLHMDSRFSTSRGFQGRVVHGVLIMAFVSRIVGVNFPGRNAFLHSINVKYLLPTYINDTMKITLTIEQVSLETNVIIVTLCVTNNSNGVELVKGKLQIGFTEEINTK